MKNKHVMLIALLTSGLTFVQAQEGTIVQGNNLAEKVDWLNVFAQSNTSYIIEVNANESGGFNISKSGITVILRGVGANRTLNIGAGNGVTLVLDRNITIREQVSVVGYTLIMNDGATITRGGVVVSVNGTFTMNGGTISNVIKIDDYYGYTMPGVTVQQGGAFTMNGGTISRNTSGVRVMEGTFTMNNGTISGNNSRGDGGGVYVGKGTFTMSGGDISGNTATSSRDIDNNGYGGGVFINDNVSFTLSGGTISGNTASRGGGGVYVRYGTFIMRGGTISGNTASRDDGGGVNLSSGTFTMSGGTISGNNGGGVYVSGTFTKTGGTIYGYSASDTVNSNVVRDSSGAVRNFQGHAVRAGYTSTLLKIREGTAGPGDNLSFNDRANPPTASGAWDN
jgi:hypothetical protein